LRIAAATFHTCLATTSYTLRLHVGIEPVIILLLIQLLLPDVRRSISKKGMPRKGGVGRGVGVRSINRADAAARKGLFTSHIVVATILQDSLKDTILSSMSY
jgi:hypothetical protein